MVMLKKSVVSGLTANDSIVIVADTTDSGGGPMARAMGERVGLDPDAEASRAHARGEIPTSIAVVPVRPAVELFKTSNPSISAGIEQAASTGRVRVVVVGAGGSTLVHVPILMMGGGGSA